MFSEAFLGKSVKNAVVTVPAYFNDSQRQASQFTIAQLLYALANCGIDKALHGWCVIYTLLLQLSLCDYNGAKVVHPQTCNMAALSTASPYMYNVAVYILQA